MCKSQSVWLGMKRIFLLYLILMNKKMLSVKGVSLLKPEFNEPLCLLEVQACTVNTQRAFVQHRLELT